MANIGNFATLQTSVNHNVKGSTGHPGSLNKIMLNAFQKNVILCIYQLFFAYRVRQL